MKKYVAFDIEIGKALDDPNTWREHRPLGITCAATFRTDDPAPVLWYPGWKNDDDLVANPEPRNMDKLELLELLAYLEDMQAQGFKVLTWNGLQFDFDVLAEECGDLNGTAKVAWEHVDMMFQILCMKGFPLSLAAAAEGMGLEGKAEGMSGELAPPLWNDDNETLSLLGRDDLVAMSPLEKRRHVVHYVGMDTYATISIAEACDKKGALLWISKKGRNQFLRLPRGWLSVKDCMMIPFPDTSWMTEPIPRQKMFAWIPNIF